MSDNGKSNRQSSPSSLDDDDTPSNAITFIVQLTRYKSVTKAGKNGKSSTKLEKDVTQKELVHALKDTSTGYLAFLCCILSCHNVKEFAINGEGSAFKFKYYSRGILKANAVDVEDFNEYKDMAKKFWADKVIRAMVLVDFNDVKEAQSRARDSSCDDSGNGEFGAGLSDQFQLAIMPNMSTLDQALAHFRRLIVKEWGNQSDNVATYIFSDGARLRLTPLMIKAWARVIYDGQKGVSIHSPPTSTLFDPSNKRAVLTDRTSQVLSPTPTLGSNAGLATASDSGQVLMTFVASLAQIMAASSASRLNQSNDTSKSTTAPSTPRRADTVMPASSPIPSPTQIPRYLAHVEEKLGVAKAKTLAPEFMSKGWGPDILANIPLEEIKQQVASINGTDGDVVRIQTNGMKWWKSSEAKRKRSNTQTSLTDEPWVQYQQEEPNGTMRGWPGHPPKRGKATPMDQYTTYLDDRIGYRISIPPGWTAGAPLGSERQDKGSDGEGSEANEAA